MFEILKRVKYEIREKDDRVIAVEYNKNKIYDIGWASIFIGAVLFLASFLTGLLFNLFEEYLRYSCSFPWMNIVFIAALFAFAGYLLVCFTYEFRKTVMTEAEFDEYRKRIDNNDALIHGGIKARYHEWEILVLPAEKVDEIRESLTPTS